MNPKDTMQVRHYGEVTLKILPSRESMGSVAAREAAACLRDVLAQKEQVNVLFAAAPSQAEFLQELAEAPDLDWTRVNALHMDEYLGLAKDSESTFRNFLFRNFFEKVPLGQVFYVNDAEGSEAIVSRYRQILEDHPLDIVFLGIGENGHIAFNDPPVADFEDPVAFKIVNLDEACRKQQVHDKTFPSFDSVPTQAYTVTIPPIVEANFRFCIVPSSLKAKAVREALEGPITTACPASILRTVPTRMYVDDDAASLLTGK